MTAQIQNNFRVRRSFGKIRQIIEIPNLIEMQKKSFEKFLQADKLSHERENTGLQAVFKSVFPIKDFNETCQLNFVAYHLEPPKYDVEECRQRGVTYAATIRVEVRLVIWKVDEETGSKEIEDITEQEVFFGEIPLMTEQGTFIISGTERVVVSQLHRSPGVFYEHDKGKTHSSGKYLYSARVIPYRGSWIDFEFDAKDILFVRIDRRRKLPATVLLRALGYTTAELLNEFYDTELIYVARPPVSEANFVCWLNNTAGHDVLLGNDLLLSKGEPQVHTKLTDWAIQKLLEQGTSPVPLTPDYLVGCRLADDAFNQNGELVLNKGAYISFSDLERLRDEGVETLQGKFFVPCEHSRALNIDLLLGQKAERDIYSSDGKMILKAGTKFGNKHNGPRIKRIRESGVDRLPVPRNSLIGRIAAEDIFDPEEGEILVQVNEEITADILDEIEQRNITSFRVLFIEGNNAGSLRDTLNQDKINTPEEAMMEIYRRLRPGEPPTMETATSLFNNLFFNPDRYDLSSVGRLKLNHKFDLHDTPLNKTVLTPQDILEVVRYLINLRNNKDGFDIDDIDHLGNRRVRAVGELLENQYRIGLVRMERAIKERMVIQEVEQLMPHDLINPKPVNAVVKEFFGSSQLSQFMDQTNPLSEVTHKRRLSALGPGGLTRDRAGFEVRDVHTTHYGRICPIETPEGPNIGLIASLATYARVNQFGFVETPYRKVESGRVLDGVQYFSALDEERYTIAQANAVVNDDGFLAGPFVTVRKGGETFSGASPSEVQLMDVSPNQLVSIAASLIPFLEHDDANRALMGSNMQRQAVPLLRTVAPLVGTGIERIVARDSGVTVVAKRDGLVDYVDASRIVVRVDTDDARNELGTQVDIYKLIKYQRSNQNTSINQKPIVKRGDRVYKGDVIADGPATSGGELALGQNCIVAFMSWGGYNFEDSILINERVVKEDIYTSIHIEEIECYARETKLGKEEITRDIPNVGEEALKDLDESGIIRIGAEVKPGDILVGKITPKGETQLSPEEKLLRAIFGEKAGDVRDSSERAKPGQRGIVIDARVFSRRKGDDRDARTRQIEDDMETRLQKDMNAELQILRKAANEKLRQLLDGQTTAGKLIHQGETLVPAGKKLTIEILDGLPRTLWADIPLVDEDVQERVRRIEEAVEDQRGEISKNYQERIERMKKGDDLQPGVLKMVKVYLAVKRKLQVGDKMAGRHGNKGVVSRILPEEDMPYLADGTPVDIVLNPLGVPSRMNVGQILETHLGWAALGLGQRINEMLESRYADERIRDEVKSFFEPHALTEYEGGRVNVWELLDGLHGEELRFFCQGLRRGMYLATPVFDGASEAEIRQKLQTTGLPKSGQTILFDGRTGDIFASDVTVGVMYMLKLHHLVDDKIHARSIGPYSLVTQQPLGGKAQFGGQRLGEMEVWAMEAYGAAYSLQEFLTVKSDDVVGRTRMYEAIVKGDNMLESGLPESFNVLIKELQSLALDVELVEDKEEESV